MIPSYSMIPAVRWSIWSIDFVNPKSLRYGDTSISDGLVFIGLRVKSQEFLTWSRWPHLFSGRRIYIPWVRSAVAHDMRRGKYSPASAGKRGNTEVNNNTWNLDQQENGIRNSHDKKIGGHEMDNINIVLQYLSAKTRLARYGNKCQPLFYCV